MTLTIFGSTGDLSLRKLFPALYNIYSLNKVNDDFKVVAIGRKALTHQEFIEMIKPKICEYARLSFDEDIFKDFSAHIFYYQMNLTEESDYTNLNVFYHENQIKDQTFYLALSPLFFHSVIKGFKKLDHIERNNVIIEKPFGISTLDMIDINQKLMKIFPKDHIYYIDHYLGKEMIQNIKTIRFKNALFKNSWNHEMIDSIQISALEADGVLNRGAYYDSSGALKDMVQNHLLQILTILTMEEGNNQHEAQLQILKKLRIDQVLLGQYEGYRNEKDVDEHSTTETYAELKCFIDNERWKNVPIYIRTGKKLKRREIVVIVKFKALEESPSNLLEIRIQPTEGVYLQFNIKKPGAKDQIETVQMDFCQSCVEINRINTPEAYERLFEEVFHHQREYFSSFEQILLSSSLIENIQKPMPFIYNKMIPYSLTEWVEIPHSY